MLSRNTYSAQLNRTNQQMLESHKINQGEKVLAWKFLAKICTFLCMTGSKLLLTSVNLCA